MPVGSIRLRKITTLRMIAGVETQSSGEVWVDGQLFVVWIQPTTRKTLYWSDLSGFCFISAFDSMAKRWIWISKNNEGIREKAYDLLSKVGLSSKSDKYPHELSGGNNNVLHLFVHWRQSPE